jgi:hypothetical protein
MKNYNVEVLAIPTQNESKAIVFTSYREFFEKARGYWGDFDYSYHYFELALANDEIHDLWLELDVKNFDGLKLFFQILDIRFE